MILQLQNKNRMIFKTYFYNFVYFITIVDVISCKKKILLES